MVRARTWFTLFIISLGTVAATASCGSDEATGAGAAGGGVLGAGAGGRAGSTGRAGSAGSGGGSLAGVSALGAKCSMDGDCGTGLTCITPGSTVFGSGGPSLGMCTATCTADADCNALETGAACINVGTTAAPTLYCFEGCTQGGDSTAFDTKCQGRADFACVDLSDPNATPAVPDPFCLPRCARDLDCGTGLFCSKRTGLCSKTKRTGDAVGTPCDPSATTNSCEGICLGVSSTDKTVGRCAEICSGLEPCMFAANKPGGLCTGPLSVNFGPLDEGFCEPNCTCPGDCAFPDDTCWGWPAADAALAMQLGAPGTCYASTIPIVTGSVELTCGEGGAGGSAGDIGPGGAGGAEHSVGGASGGTGGASGGTGGASGGTGGASGGTGGASGGTGGASGGVSGTAG